ncbi:MAG: class I SAM-dependent methyltransferase [Chlamydiia bacterium]|nr:class I SAM-dependent methyltransferase [Chlamydiia bacterium]
MVDYALLDSGNGRKLEKFGPYTLDRPAAQAVWKPKLSKSQWQQADLFFTREGKYAWKRRSNVPDEWQITIDSLKFQMQLTDFGHLGIFPEQIPLWKWIQSRITRPMRVLNLFAYSGGATLAAAQAGAEVCHLDASKGMVAWARENAALNQLDKAPIRWIVDDVNKFLLRELNRKRQYDAIILDPPSFGRGAKGEIFKIEHHLNPLLDQCRSLLTVTPAFILFSCHTPGFTPTTMQLLLEQLNLPKGKIEVGEMLLEETLPSGVYGRWFS